MHEDGIIQLPPPRLKHGNGKKYSGIGSPIDIPTHSFTEPAGNIHDLRIEIVNTTTESRLWNDYIHRYHYLGYKPLPGAQLRYIATTPAKPAPRCQ